MNAINVSEMDAMVTESIVSQIGKNTSSMPSKEDLDAAHEGGRLLPPHRTENITSPSEVYNLDDVITPEEMELLWVNDWYDVKRNGEQVQIKGNTHVTNRLAKLPLLSERTPGNVKRLKMFKYISILKNLYSYLTSRSSERALQRGNEKDIRQHLGISSDLLTILLAKYTEEIGGPDRAGRPGGEEKEFTPRVSRKASPMLLARLLNYLAIMCLMVEDHFQVDVYYLKGDLGLQLTE